MSPSGKRGRGRLRTQPGTDGCPQAANSGKLFLCAKGTNFYLPIYLEIKL